MKTFLNIFFYTSLASVLLLAACGDFDFAGSDSSGKAESGNSGDGKGGSMARFTINGNYMYTVDHSTLKIFDISDAGQPEYLERKNQDLRFGIETIFSMDTLLFIGSQDGMYIYDVTRQEFPQLLSFVSHIRSCDPVVASGQYAYVTLSSDRQWCGNTSNVLNIYDISNLRYPVLKVSESLNHPKGLGIDGNKLFVCESRLGVKVYDVSDPLNPRWIDDWTHQPETVNAVAYDVIPVNGLLLVTTDRGLYQFDYTGEKLRFVSKIITVKK